MVYVIEPPVIVSTVPIPSDHPGISTPRSTAMRAYPSSLARLRIAMFAAGTAQAQDREVRRPTDRPRQRSPQ